MNGLQADSPVDVINVEETGGPNDFYIDRRDYSVFVVAQANSKVKARDYAYSVYNLLHKKFRLILPEETVDSTLYPAVKTYRILATETPQSLGSDENGRNLFSVNFIITTE